MAKQSKYDLEGIKKLYDSVKGSRKLFLEQSQASPYNVPKKYSETLYYKLSHSKSGALSGNDAIPLSKQTSAPTAQPVAPVEPEAQPVTVEIIKPSDVKTTADQPKPETSELRDRYKDMFNQVNKEAKGSKVADTSSSSISTPSTTSEVTNEEGEPTEILNGPDADFGSPSEGGGMSNLQNSRRKMQIKLGQLFYQIGVSVDNNLLWRERPLTTDEKETIREFSGDLETEYEGFLDSEYAPWINYGLAVLGVPAVSRLDLIPKKIDDLVKFFNENKPVSQSNPVNRTPQTNQPKTDASGGVQVVPQQKSVVDLNNYQGGARSFVEACIKNGYSVSPNYKDGNAIDREAYARGVLRNMGDRFDG